MEVYVVPIEGRFILYRPLLRLAFVGNRAMADLTLRLVRQERSAGATTPETGATTPEAVAFLEAIGFLQPDPPPPPPLDRSFHPTSAVLLLTNRCNLRCTYCYASGGEGVARDLSLELARAAIDHICQNAVERGQPQFELGFHGGGEPVQAWGVLQEATAYARSRALPCYLSMVSNGVWTARQREWILHNLDSVNISFDGGQATQDRQRPFVSGRGSFKAAMHTIQALDKAGFSYGIRMTATPPFVVAGIVPMHSVAPTPPPFVVATSVAPTPPLAEEAPWRGTLPEDVRFICQETGCPVMQVEPAFNARRGEHQGPTQQEGQAFAQAFMEAFEIANQAGRHLTYSGARPWLIARTFCTAPYDALIVNAAGNLVACYEIVDENHALAPMFKVGHIAGSQIAVDDQARHALQARLEERRAGCQGCFCYWHCAGDCYPRSMASGAGTPQAPSPRCTMNREITARTLLWYIQAGDGVWQGQGMTHPKGLGDP